MNNDDRLDWSQETPSLQEMETPKAIPFHLEKARITLAYWVLGGIFFIFLLAIACSFANHVGWVDCETGKALFEFCKTGLLPIVTLILGYYFSKAND